jgi:hypothetical protein
MIKTILFSLVLAGFGLNAQNSSPNHKGNVRSDSAGSKEDLSRLAGQMLDDVNKAKIALKKGNYQLATQDVNRARSTLERIEAGAHGATLIPVYQEFVSVSILSPIRMEQNTRKQSRASNKQPAAQVSTGNAVVHEVAGDYTRVMVSTVVAKNGLDAAKAALAMSDWKTAEDALSDVQEGVQIQSVKSDMPLSEARENLILARAAVRQGRYAEAKTALDTAAKSLSEYEAEGAPHASEAKSLQPQIEDLARNIEQQHAEAAAKINKWWNITSNWDPYKSAEAVR